MAHAFWAPRPAAVAAPCPARRRQPSAPPTVKLGGSPPPQQQHQQRGASIAATAPQQRRSFVYGMVAAGVGFVHAMHAREANAAGKRGPPPPPTEKKDPNVSGVQAKVLASRKRKEAMKEAMAKLRERGKPVVEVLEEQPSSTSETPQ